MAGQIIGRDAELRQLDTLVQALREDRAACLGIEGEPGIGKTRLLHELRARAEAAGHIVLAGAAAEFERDLPLSVFVDALDAYVVAQDVRSSPEWDADLERELGLVLPSLGGATGPGTVPDERYRAHRAIGRLLAIIATDAPLTLILDDLHWSDDASLELIAALVRRPPPAPVLLALGYRPGPAADRLWAALRGPHASRVRLGELTRDQATQLLGGDATATYELAGGNPFFLEQLGRAAPGSNGAPRAAGVLVAGVPAAVTAAIAEELGELAPLSRAFLEAAAVAGEPFDPSLAAAVGELSEADAFAALDDVLALELARPTAIPRRFSFRHPLVRHAVYEGTGGGWRLAAHARAAAALAEQGAAATDRARHVEQSALPGDAGAIAVLLEAGRANAARAPAAAARWFEAALRLVPADSGDQVGVRIELATVLRSVGELDRCRATLLEAIALLGPDDTMQRVELTALCAVVEHWQGEHDEAHRRLTRAWDELPARDTAAAAAVQIELTIDGLYRGDFDGTIAMGEAALAAATALGDRSLIAAAASALAMGEACCARVGPAREHCALAVEYVDRMDDAELAVRLETMYYLGWAENYLEHYDAAIAHADRGAEIARATGQGRLLVPLLLVRCFPFEMQGRLAEVNEMTSTAVEIARLSANPHYVFWALFELAWARYFAGDLAGAIAAGEESVQAGGRLVGGTIPSAGGGPGWALAVAHFELGDVDRAYELMLEVGGPDMENWVPAERYFNWENLALAEIARGNAAAAEEYARLSEAAAAAVDLKFPTAFAARTRAAVALAAGDPAAAVTAAETSIAAAEAIGAVLEAAFSRALLGDALAAAGDRTRAIAVLRQAENELDAYGSVRMRDQVRSALRKLGARAEARGPATGESGIASLTKREREISELVTDRMTNREIAAQLFLSEKTIESHVRNVFFKLGVSSRVDVARIIERETRRT